MAIRNFKGKKIGALIVTYNPKLSLLIKNIEAIKEQVEELIIVDNGSSNKNKIETLTNDYGISSLFLEKNMGIAYAQNRGMEFLESKGMVWGVTLDQDSIVPKNMVEQYVNSIEYKKDDTGILALQFCDPEWNDSLKKIKLKSFEINTLEKRVIASGNLVRIKAWRDVEGFDEWLFIDSVDFDFDAKIILKGYKIWQINNIVMRHKLGQVVDKPFLKRVLLYSKNTVFADHSPFREYYIHRNMFIYNKRYPEFRDRGNLWIVFSLLQMRQILIFPNSLIKLRQAIRGVVDGMKYNPKKDKKFQVFKNKLM